jgi:hypothetical protein
MMLGNPMNGMALATHWMRPGKNGILMVRMLRSAPDDII